METRAGDPGAFAHFDLSRVDSPAFVVDAATLTVMTFSGTFWMGLVYAAVLNAAIWWLN